jgi:nitrate reductase / nitrite oxidoreductase, alpha subunit
MPPVSRRDFLKLAGAAAAGSTAVLLTNDLAFLEPIPQIDSPFSGYPNRGWEHVYERLNTFDDTFAFLCAPNDTHNCLLMASTRNGVVTRIDPSFRYGDAKDLYGNPASHRWEPRACQKGIGLTQRFYGDRRVKGAMVRSGYLRWVEDGFPRDPDTGLADQRYFSNRGQDDWVRMSHEDAYAIVARALVEIATAYSGDDGADRLAAQGYDPAMIEAMNGAGTQSLKFRGGMPFLGATRTFGLYRFANMLSLLDSHVRGTDADSALGARGWDNYSWHTDLPPGHPMVTGQQTVDFDLFTAENAEFITLWGMNWISTKMPDGHWLSEARLHGAKVFVIATEYQSTSNKADEMLVIRPGTDTALALGLAHIIIDEGRMDEDFVKSFTDLPLLVRGDTLELLRASDIDPDYEPEPLENYVRVLGQGESAPPNRLQDTQLITEAMRERWGDFVVWDESTGDPVVVSRDKVGQHFLAEGVSPALRGEMEVTLVDGETITVRPVFDLVWEYLEHFDPETVSEITWAPVEGIYSLARQIADHPGATLLAHGMGPNHFFNADLKDRAIFLVAALTRNIGYLGGTPGSYAGNYRGGIFNGLPFYVNEDPFQVQLDPAGDVRTRAYLRSESAHYFNYGDRPLRVGNKLFTGATHLPTPTKFCWWANSNSILGNAKWAYDLIHNTLPRIETIVVNEWWWSMTCEYADVVFGVDSWAEFKHPDMAGSVTNPFVTVFPRTPLPRIFETVADIEALAGVARALGEEIADERCEEYWRFVHEGRVDIYLQRIVENSSSLRGYRFDEMEELASQGIPTLKLMRTYPKVVGWEQTQESKPWYTRTGRLEFYRDEPEFIEHGENLPVYREPVDATPHEPNVIVGLEHDAIRPTGPEAYGLDLDDQSTEVRQVRNVLKSWDEVRATQHPLTGEGFEFVFITPKYRHGAHTTPVDLYSGALFFGPFGDPYRRDKRMPYVNEGYVDINPMDARELGIEDGDYVWIDADPSDRPYRGWKSDDADYAVFRLACRARYYPGTPRKVLRMWFNMYQATHGTVEGARTREDGLAKNPRTNYQAMFRSGGHQSAVRAWLRPTLMSDHLYRKDYFGQVIGQGFASDVYCVVGAPKESYVRITKAEDGAIGGEGIWRPAVKGYRPTYENDAMTRYLDGGYIEVR